MGRSRPNGKSAYRLFLKLLVTACMALVALLTVAEAKEETVRNTDHGLVDVAKRACGSILWTSEARLPLGRNNPARLKVGDVVTFPDNCRQQKLSKAVRRATIELFKAGEIKRQEEQTQKANADLLIKVTGERDAANREIDRLKTEKAGLIERAKNAEKAAKLAATSAGSWRNIAVTSITGGVIAVVLALAGWFFFYRMRTEKNEFEISLERSQEALREVRKRALKPVTVASLCFSVEVEGEVIEFKDTTEPTAGCNHCTETKLKPNPDELLKHIEQCILLRVRERKPTKIRELLALGST